MPIDEAEAVAHRWQDFRIRCLELAVKSGATEANAIEVADKFGLYILRKSEIELRTTEKKET